MLPNQERQYWMYHFNKVISSVLYFESGYTVDNPSGPALGIFLELKLYFPVYPSSRHDTDTISLPDIVFTDHIPSHITLFWILSEKYQR